MYGNNNNNMNDNNNNKRNLPDLIDVYLFFIQCLKIKA